MEPASLEDNIIYQTAKLTKLFQGRMEAAFKKAGFTITVEQFTILVLLWYRDGISQQEISEAIDRDKTTVSRRR
jgi:DNA-binding MarR family transcriptional regulator